MTSITAFTVPVSAAVAGLVEMGQLPPQETGSGLEPMVYDPTALGLGPGSRDRRSAFESLFSGEGPPDIHSPRFLPTVEQLAPRPQGGTVKILFAEGPGEVIPSARFVTTIPGVDVERLSGLVNEISSWPDWIPMLGAIQVHQTDDGPAKIQKFTLSLEGMAAKLLGLDIVRSTHRMEEERHQGIAQSRWTLVPRDDEDLATNSGSWTLVPLRDKETVAIYEGHQVLKWVKERGRIMRTAAVMALRSQVRGHLRTVVVHLTHRSTDQTWTKRSPYKPGNIQFIVEDA